MSELYQSLSHSKWDVLRSLRTQATPESDFRPDTSPPGPDLPLARPTEGVPDS